MHINTRRLMLFITLVFVFSFAAVLAAQSKQVKPGKNEVKITAKQAEKIALKKYPGKIAEKTTLENEEGVWQYGVMVRSGKTLREVMVNAKTGKIDSVEVTTNVKEKDEANKEKAKAKNN